MSDEGIFPKPVPHGNRNRDSQQSWSRCFVRSAKKRPATKMAYFSDAVKAPFELGPSSSSGGMPVWWTTDEHWLFGVAPEGYAWAALISNAGDGHQLFGLSSKSKRLDMVNVGFDAEKLGWFFHLNRAGKIGVRFELPDRAAGQLDKAVFKSSELDRDFVADCDSGQAAVEKLCNHYEVDIYGCLLEINEQVPRLLDANGKTIKGRMESFKDTGPLPVDNPEAGFELKEAIWFCDLKGIRSAISAGASLDRFPEAGVSPFKLALSRVGTSSRAKDCVRILFEEGCDVNGTANSPVMTSTGGKVDQVALLLELGADPNFPEKQTGRTPLMEAITSYNAWNDESIQLLLDHGANPSIPDKEGRSVIDSVRAKIRRFSFSHNFDSDAVARNQELLEWLLPYAEKADRVVEKAAAQEAGRGEKNTTTNPNEKSGQAIPQPGKTAPSTVSHPAMSLMLLKQKLTASLNEVPSAITPSARIFNGSDLDGTPYGLRQFDAAVKEATGVSLEPALCDLFRRTKTDQNGLVTTASVQQIRKSYPDWVPEVANPPLRDLLTVSLLICVVNKAVSDGSPHVAGPDDVVEYMRSKLARIAEKPVDIIQPQTQLYKDIPRVNEFDLFRLYKRCDRRFRINALELVVRLQQCVLNSTGDNISSVLPAAGVAAIVKLLPDLDVSIFEPLRGTNVLSSMAGVEAILRSAYSRRRKTAKPVFVTPEPETWTRPGTLALPGRVDECLLPDESCLERWTKKLPQKHQLGTRKFRLLLSGALRHGKDSSSKSDWGAIITEALDRYEKYIETGGTRGFVKLQRELRRDWVDHKRKRASPEIYAILHLLKLEEEIKTLPLIALVIGDANMNALLADLKPTKPVRFLAAWRSSEACELANEIYESRRFELMFDLAECLEQAGCTNSAILDHCRNPMQPHIRGCWVLDSILNKPK